MSQSHIITLLTKLLIISVLFISSCNVNSSNPDDVEDEVIIEDENGEEDNDSASNLGHNHTGFQIIGLTHVGMVLIDSTGTIVWSSEEFDFSDEVHADTYDYLYLVETSTATVQKINASGNILETIDLDLSQLGSISSYHFLKFNNESFWIFANNSVYEIDKNSNILSTIALDRNNDQGSVHAVTMTDTHVYFATNSIVYKKDFDDNLLWYHPINTYERNLESTIWQSTSSMTVDSDGNVYVADIFDEYYSTGPIVKINNEGEKVWQEYFQGWEQKQVVKYVDPYLYTYSSSRDNRESTFKKVDTSGTVIYSKSIPAVITDFEFDRDGKIYFGSDLDGFYTLSADGEKVEEFRSGGPNKIEILDPEN